MKIISSMRVIRTVSWLAVIIWMAVIFYLSSQTSTDSNRLSTGVTEHVAYTVEYVSASEDMNILHLNRVVRKNAHFIAYLILGILVIQAMRRFSIAWQKCVVYSLLICITYAVSDEWHQQFVPGRGPEIRDVWIDSIGAIVGIGLYASVSLMRRVYKALRASGN